MSKPRISKAEIQRVAKLIYERVAVPAGKRSGVFTPPPPPIATWPQLDERYRAVFIAIARWHLTVAALWEAVRT